MKKKREARRETRDARWGPDAVDSCMSKWFVHINFLTVIFFFVYINIQKNYSYFLEKIFKIKECVINENKYK